MLLSRLQIREEISHSMIYLISYKREFCGLQRTSGTFEHLLGPLRNFEHLLGPLNTFENLYCTFEDFCGLLRTLAWGNWEHFGTFEDLSGSLWTFENLSGPELLRTIEDPWRNLRTFEVFEGHLEAFRK